MADQKTTIVIEGRDDSSAAINGAAEGLRGLAQLAGGAALSAGFVALTNQLKGMALQASSVDAVRASFNNLARDAGEDAAKLLSSLQAASRGTVVESELMKNANQAMLLMGGEVASKLPAFMEIARASAKATGQDVDYMFRSIVVGIGRASPRILDNLGMTVDLTETYDKFAQSVGKAANELTKSEQVMALASEVERQGAQFIARMGDSADTAGQKVKSFGVRLQELREDVGRALVPALNTAMDVASKFMDVLESPGVSVAIAGFGKVAMAVSGIVGPLLLLNGGLRLLRTTGFLDLAGLTANLGRWAAYSVIQLGAATGATTTLAAAQAGAALSAKAMWVAITGPVGIAVAAIGGLIALLVAGKKSADEMADAAKKAADNLREALSAPVENRTAEQLKLIAKEADMATVRLLLLKDARDKMMKESLDPGADEEIQRLNQQIAALESRIRMVNGEWQNWGKTLDMTREKWGTPIAAPPPAPSGNVMDYFSPRDVQMRWGVAYAQLAEIEKTAASNHDAYVRSVAAANERALASFNAMVNEMAGAYGATLSAKERLSTQLLNLEADYQSQAAALSGQFRVNELADEAAYQEARAKLAGKPERLAELDKDHAGKMALRKSQYDYEQALQKWNLDVQKTQAQIAYAQEWEQLKGSIIDKAILEQGGSADAVARLAESLGRQQSMKIKAYIFEQQMTGLMVNLQAMMGLSAQQAAATAITAMMNMIEAEGAGVDSLEALQAKLNAVLGARPNLPEVPDYSQYLENLSGAKAGGAGSSAAREFHSAAAESAAAVTRDLALAIESGKRAAQAIAGFAMPADADARFSQLESFLEKAVNAVYNIMQRVGGKLLNIRGSIRFIAELSNAIVEMNRALMSMVVARNLPDLTAWAADMDKMIAAAVGVVERAESTYGASRIIKAGNLAQFIGNLAGMTPAPQGPGAAGGAMTVNITVNGGNGKPADIAEAVRGAVTQSAGVLRAARARGVK